MEDKFIIKGKEAHRYTEILKSLKSFHDQFNYDDNDRAIVIVGLAYIDDLLLNCLENFFPSDSKTVDRILSHSGTLGTANSKISLIYSLGFIDKTVMQDLEKVTQIRNKFAHKTNISFEDETIIKLCKVKMA